MESTVKTFDSDQCRISFFLQQCAEMDALPIERRQIALAFSRAMTTLEGLPAREETEQELILWAEGKKKFVDIYMKVLLSYEALKEVDTTQL